MSWPSGAVLVACSLAALAPAPAALAGPSGRVVRVERSGGSRIPPRLCEIHGDAGNCIGEEPHAGQTVAVLDERRVVAEVQILEATTFSDSCPMLWTVKTRLSRGAVPDNEGIGVIDPSLDLGRAHLINRIQLPSSPSGMPEDVVWQAIDRDGDGAADIVITRYGCDADGHPASAAGTFCIDLWARTGARMTRTSQLNFGLCTR